MTSNDYVAKYINVRCAQECEMKMVKGSLYRYYRNPEIFHHECAIYMQILDYSPLMNPGIQKINYYVENMQTFRNHISKIPSKEIPFVINDVFNYILTWQSKSFVHGNLHVDNLFIHKKKHKFYILDFVNAYHKAVPEPKSYIRSSFLGEFNMKEQLNLLQYWDIFTFYLSLKSLLTNKVEIIDKYFFSYIPTSSFQQLSSFYEYNNISCSTSYLQLN